MEGLPVYALYHSYLFWQIRLCHLGHTSQADPDVKMVFRPKRAADIHRYCVEANFYEGCDGVTFRDFQGERSCLFRFDRHPSDDEI